MVSVLSVLHVQKLMDLCNWLVASSSLALGWKAWSPAQVIFIKQRDQAKKKKKKPNINQVIQSDALSHPGKWQEIAKRRESVLITEWAMWWLMCYSNLPGVTQNSTTGPYHSHRILSPSKQISFGVCPYILYIMDTDQWASQSKCFLY